MAGIRFVIAHHLRIMMAEMLALLILNNMELIRVMSQEITLQNVYSHHCKRRACENTNHF